jgi:thiol-disulfide isomerase/thioredoxin
MPSPVIPESSETSAAMDDGMHDGMDSHPSSATGNSHPEGSGHRSELADLNFTAQTLSGQSVSGAQLVGHPSVLWFWAPGCADCVRLAPTVMSSVAKHPGVMFVGVAGLGNRSAIGKASEQMHTDSLTNLIDSRGAVWRAFGVTTQPAFAFVSADGRIEVHKGSVSAADLEAMIAKIG